MKIGHDDNSKPGYLLPTLRDGIIMTQFIGAVKTRIADRQKALWSRFIGSGFVAADIQSVWPEGNMRFFGMRYAGNWQSFNITDLNLRELDELLLWLQAAYPECAKCG